MDNLKIEGWEEIPREEYNKLPEKETGFFYDLTTHKTHFFKKIKPKRNFPHVFESVSRRIEVHEKSFEIINTIAKSSITFDYDISFPVLLEAIEDAKEVIKE